MDSDPVMVNPNTDLVDVARMLLDADGPQAIVIDKRGRPVGIVSSTDILKAVDSVQPQELEFGPSAGSPRNKRFIVPV
jgi:predicted transcriptional regulator